jgi:hypothetical protein
MEKERYMVFINGIDSGEFSTLEGAKKVVEQHLAKQKKPGSAVIVHVVTTDTGTTQQRAWPTMGEINFD